MQESPPIIIDLCSSDEESPSEEPPSSSADSSEDPEEQEEPEDPEDPEDPEESEDSAEDEDSGIEDDRALNAAEGAFNHPQAFHVWMGGCAECGHLDDGILERRRRGIDEFFDTVIVLVIYLLINVKSFTNSVFLLFLFLY